jgi:hypothetical protein
LLFKESQFASKTRLAGFYGIVIDIIGTERFESHTTYPFVSNEFHKRDANVGVSYHIIIANLMMDTTECHEDYSPSTKGMIVDFPCEPRTATNSRDISATTQDMIVDFPCETRIDLSAPKSKGTASTVSTFPRPRVCISQFSQLVVIPYDDPVAKWYTREEQHHFRQAILSDIRMLSDLLRDDAALLSEETVCECLGIENFLPLSTANLVVQKRRAHSEAVLSVQRNYKGEDMMETLARTSQKSSQWARNRAARLAQGFKGSVRC